MYSSSDRTAITSSGSGRRSLVFRKSCAKTSRICSRRVTVSRPLVFARIGEHGKVRRIYPEPFRLFGSRRRRRRPPQHTERLRRAGSETIKSRGKADTGHDPTGGKNPDAEDATTLPGSLCLRNLLRSPVRAVSHDLVFVGSQLLEQWFKAPVAAIAHRNHGVSPQAAALGPAHC